MIDEWTASKLQEARECFEWIAVQCHVPPWDVYAPAWRDALFYGRRFLQSSALVLYLTMQPIIYIVGYVVHFVGSFLYRHGLHQLQIWSTKAYQFHRSLTWKQWIIEISTILISIGVWKLRRSQWWKHTLLCIDYRRQQAVKVRAPVMCICADVRSVI